MTRGPRAVVAGGGSVGRLFAGALAPTWSVTVVDLARGRGGNGAFAAVTGDVTAPDPALRALLGGSELVLLALPEPAAVAAAPEVAAALPPGALLADTCSAKTRILPLLADCAGSRGIECVSLNPMFAPDLGFAGRPVALVPVAPGPRSDLLGDALRDAGARLVPVEAGEYDRVASALQVATHAAVIAFGAAVRERGVDLGTLVDLGPPPFQAMLALLARIVSSRPAVYHDIQAAGAEAATVRDDLAGALAALEAVARPDRLGDFAALLDDLAGWLGPHREDLAVRCASLFRCLPAPEVRAPADLRATPGTSQGETP